MLQNFHDAPQRVSAASGLSSGLRRGLGLTALLKQHTSILTRGVWDMVGRWMVGSWMVGRWMVGRRAPEKHIRTAYGGLSLSQIKSLSFQSITPCPVLSIEAKDTPSSHNLSALTIPATMNTKQSGE